MKPRFLCLLVTILLSLCACTPTVSKPDHQEQSVTYSETSEATASLASSRTDAEPHSTGTDQSGVESVPDVKQPTAKKHADDSISDEKHSASDSHAITQSEFESFRVTVADAQEHAVGFRDFQETMNSSFLGTWFDPELGEAFRLIENAAYVYIPYLDCYGDVPCPWELTDRSDEGKCPKLSIYCFGEDGPALVYYVAGNTGDYFWCVSQGQLFYQQD